MARRIVATLILALLALPIGAPAAAADPPVDPCVVHVKPVWC